MSDDIISRSALKEDFESRLALCNEWIEKAKDKETKIRADATKHFICEVIMTIDNAQTVESDKDLYEKNETYKNAYRIMSDAFENEVRKNKRPQQRMIKDDFLIVAGPRRSGKTTELINHVRRINNENGGNVAVIICSNHAEAHFISEQADKMGYKDMPFPIPINALIGYARSGHMKGSFYKVGFVDEIDRVLQSLIAPLELRGFTYTLPNKEGEADG